MDLLLSTGRIFIWRGVMSEYTEVHMNVMSNQYCYVKRLATVSTSIFYENIAPTVLLSITVVQYS